MDVERIRHRYGSKRQVSVLASNPSKVRGGHYKHCTVRQSEQYHLPSPRELLATTSIPRSSDDPSETQDASSSGDENGRAKRPLSELDEDYDGVSSSALSSEEVAQPRRRKKSVAMTRRRAAYVLMQLSMADASLRDDGHRRISRREPHRSRDLWVGGFDDDLCLTMFCSCMLVGCLLCFA
jgi:hypothetical protein